MQRIAHVQAWARHTDSCGRWLKTAWSGPKLRLPREWMPGDGFGAVETYPNLPMYDTSGGKDDVAILRKRNCMLPSPSEILGHVGQIWVAPAPNQR